MTHRLVQRALQARIERHGVTPRHVVFPPGALGRGRPDAERAVAPIGTMEPTTLSAIAAMEQAGMVRRERHATDRRKVKVFLTDKGRGLQAAAAAGGHRDGSPGACASPVREPSSDALLAMLAKRSSASLAKQTSHEEDRVDGVASRHRAPHNRTRSNRQLLPGDLPGRTTRAAPFVTTQPRYKTPAAAENDLIAIIAAAASTSSQGAELHGRSGVQHQLARLRARHADHHRALPFAGVEHQVPVVRLALDQPACGRCRRCRSRSCWGRPAMGAHGLEDGGADRHRQHGAARGPAGPRTACRRRAGGPGRSRNPRNAPRRRPVPRHVAHRIHQGRGPQQ